MLTCCLTVAYSDPSKTNSAFRPLSFALRITTSSHCARTPHSQLRHSASARAAHGHILVPPRGHSTAAHPHDPSSTHRNNASIGPCEEPTTALHAQYMRTRTTACRRGIGSRVSCRAISSAVPLYRLSRLKVIRDGSTMQSWRIHSADPVRFVES